MIYSFTAEWPISQGDKDFLAAYFNQRWSEAIRLCRIRSAIDLSPFDPHAQRPPWFTTEVFLKLGNWTSPTAPNGAAGQFFPPEIDNAPTPKIWINWAREFDPSNNLFQRIVRHELVHLLLWLQNGVGYSNWFRDYQNSEHGALAPNEDPFLLAINQFVNELWPKNHSSWPGDLLKR